MSETFSVHPHTGRFMVLPQDHVHAYLVELDHAVVVVDATLALDSARALRARAEAIGKPIAGVLLTHGHPDHYTGLAVFADVPRYASQGALDFAHEEDVVKSPVATMYLGDDYPKVRVFPDRIIGDGFVLSVDDVDFRFTDVGPAESPADGMWSVVHRGLTHAFVGDTVADRVHCFVRDGHAQAWLAALDRLEATLPEDARIYLGHGPTPATKAAIDWQRRYVHTFFAAIDAVPDKRVPVTRAVQESVIAAMQRFLPSTATLFLFDYELDVSIPRYWRERGFDVAQGESAT